MIAVIWDGLKKYAAPALAASAFTLVAGLWVRGNLIEASRDEWRARAAVAESTLEQARLDLTAAAVNAAVLNERLTALATVEQKQDDEARALARRALTRAAALEGRLNDVFEASAPVVSGDGGPDLAGILREQNDAANRERRGEGVAGGAESLEGGAMSPGRGADGPGRAGPGLVPTPRPDSRSTGADDTAASRGADPVSGQSETGGLGAGDATGEAGDGLAGGMAGAGRVPEPCTDAETGIVILCPDAIVWRLVIEVWSDEKSGNGRETVTLDYPQAKFRNSEQCRDVVPAFLADRKARSTLADPFGPDVQFYARGSCDLVWKEDDLPLAQEYPPVTIERQSRGSKI